MTWYITDLAWLLLAIAGVIAVGIFIGISGKIRSLKCSYYKIGKEATGDEKLWKVNITDPCNKPAMRIYNGIAICEKHFKETMEEDKEAIFLVHIAESDLSKTEGSMKDL